MRKGGFAALAVLTAVAAVVAASVGSAGTTRTAQQAKSRNCAFNLRIGDVLPFTGDLAAYGAQPRPRRQGRDQLAERRAEAGRPLEQDQGHARRLGGRPDAGERLGRGGDEADQVEPRQRDHRRDGLERDDPDGAVGHDPEPRRPDLADLERAADQRHQGQRLPLAHVSVRHAAGEGARAGRGRRVRQGRDDQRRRAQRRVRHRAQGSCSSRGTRRSAARSASTISWNPDQANFDSEMGQLVSGSPKGWVIIDFPETFQKYVASLVRTGKWDATKTFMTEALRDTTVLDAIGAPGDRAPRHRRERGRRAGRRVVRHVLEEPRDGREAVHRLRGHGARRRERRVPRGAARRARRRRRRSRRTSSRPPGRPAPRSRSSSSRRRSS